MVKNSRRTFPTSQRKRWLNTLQASAASANRGARISPHLRIVLDSNIWVSAIIYSGQAEKVVLYCLDNASIIISDEISDELYEHFRNVAKAPYKWLRNFQQVMDIVCEVVTTGLSDFSPIDVRDSKDLHIITAAINGQCDYIVTGDKDLLVLKRYEGTKIISPAEFLELPKVKKNLD